MLLIFFSIILFGLSLAGDRYAHCPNLSGVYQSNHDSTLCYTFNRTLATFEEAEDHCKDMGGHLASVPDIFANVYLAGQIGTNNFWIGAYQVQPQSSQVWAWKWYDSVIKYSDWDKGQPEQNYQCASLDGATASWQSQPCSSKKPFVCQLPTVLDVCDSGWTYYPANYPGPSCYKLFNKNNTFFSDGETLCVQNGGHLTSMYYYSSSEMNFIRKLVVSPPQTLANTGVWTGYSYPNGYTDGTYSGGINWYNNQPSSNYPYGVYIPDGTTDYPSYAGYLLAVNSTTSFSRYLCKKPATSYPYIMKKLFKLEKSN
uniref:C-type lectin domain-containing protein n=1 Tax=Panagrolaimus sp. JU765 TaxID=591449 RepID=A0AC34RS87_9BILA